MFFKQVVGWFNSLSPDLLGQILRVSATVILGYVVIRLVAALTQRYIMRKSTPQRQMIARKAITYLGFFLVLMAVLGELGVKLTALLGAAGIVAVAVGFASQTSVSNIISGLFLISEKPFAIGDVIKIGGTTGIIQSIDLLSIKIRTFDNMFVRIPNEKILTSEVTNITRFPIRRMDIMLQVSYEADLDRVRQVLGEVAVANPWCLDEPAAGHRGERLQRVGYRHSFRPLVLQERFPGPEELHHERRAQALPRGRDPDRLPAPRHRRGGESGKDARRGARQADRATGAQRMMVWSLRGPMEIHFIGVPILFSMKRT